MPEGDAWVRIKGDGLAVEGRCLVKGVLWYCKNQGNQCFLYDGLDVTSGKLFCHLSGGNTEAISLGFGEGVEFASGVYVDQSTTGDEATIIFRTLS